MLADPKETLRALDRLDCEEGLLPFVRHMWPIIEPATPFVDGWPIEAVCEHLEAVTAGEITRLLINVPPGSMKSLLVNVFWPAWEWGPKNRPHERYLSFSYSAHLTQRDNRRFRDIVRHPRYQDLFGDRFTLTKEGEQLVINDRHGFKVATSVGGVSTGERGTRVILDDPHNVREIESDKVRQDTVDWFATSMSNRLNDMQKSAIVVVMQRLHEEDVSGYILSKELGYEHLCIPAEFEPSRAYSPEGKKYATSIGWTDPRTDEGQLFWEDRFPEDVLKTQRINMGPFGYAGQYQQSPTPKGGGILKASDWRLWEEEQYPPFEYVVASLDPAYTEKEENDYSAMTVWGIFSETSGRVIAGSPVPENIQRNAGIPRVMLIYAWQRRLELHGSLTERWHDEDIEDYIVRLAGVLRKRGEDVPKRSAYDGPAEYAARLSKASWGLVEQVADTCKRFAVDRLLIENKASGHSVAQEINRLYAHEAWGVQLVDPRGQDKVARAWSVQHLFAEGLVSAPEKNWSQMVIDQCASFPKGKYKDLVDSTTQALRHLRDGGLLRLSGERTAQMMDDTEYRRPNKPLYHV